MLGKVLRKIFYDMPGRILQKLRYNLPELAVLFLCMVILGIGVGQKEGYHMDELLSFELANAEYNPWIVPTQPEGRLAKFIHNEIDGESFGETVGNLVDTVVDVLQNRGTSKLLSYTADVYAEPVWISAEEFQDYVYTDREDDFNYLSVYFNVKDDNHPPVHFMLLHTVSSVLKGVAKPFVGCVINMAAVAVSMILLMKCGRLLAELFGMEEKGRFLGIFAALLYGCSTGALASVLLIRMYCVMTAFCVALFYYHLKKWMKGGFLKRNKGMIAVTVLGFLTQYFFLFYCLLLAALTAVLLFAEKRTKELFAYIRSMVTAAVIGLVCFPFAISDVFSSGRGVEALGNLASGLDGYGARLATFWGVLESRTFDTWIWVILLGTVGLMCVCEVLSRKHREAAAIVIVEESRTIATDSGVEEAVEMGVLGKEGHGKVPFIQSCKCLWLLLFPALGYFLLAARMSPYLVDRYIMPVFPFVMLAGATALVGLGCYIGKRYSKLPVLYILCGVILALQVINLWNYDGAYLYERYESQEAVAESYAGYPCICVYDGVGYYENLLEFTHYGKTLLVKESELADRLDTESISALDEVVVLLKINADRENVSDILDERYGLLLKEELYTDSVHGDLVLLFGR